VQRVSAAERASAAATPVEAGTLAATGTAAANTTAEAVTLTTFKYPAGSAARTTARRALRVCY
jgi:hypothetical protein